jgi:preprotein translocase subunit SecF
MPDIEDRLRQIEQRNVRVQVDKAWETSMTRRLFIASLTYLTASLFLWMIGVVFSLLSALVPTGGYLLSTLSLPWIKQQWMRRYYGRDEITPGQKGE